MTAPRIPGPRGALKKSLVHHTNQNITKVDLWFRIKGYPTICESFERKQEAEGWAQDTERNIKSGQFKFDVYKKQHTYTDLMQRMRGDGAFEH